MSDEIVIRLCGEILADHADTAQLAESRYDDPEIEPIAARVRDGLDRIAAMPAKTLPGWQSKARVYLAIPRDDLAESLAQDVLRGFAD